MTKRKSFWTLIADTPKTRCYDLRLPVIGISGGRFQNHRCRQSLDTVIRRPGPFPTRKPLTTGHTGQEQPLRGLLESQPEWV